MMHSTSLTTVSPPTPRPVRIIALVGPKQAGKTTVAGELQTGYGFERFRFADTLKNMVEALGVPRDHIDGDKKEVPLDVLCGKSARHAMQTLGTEWRDMLGKELWSLITCKKIKQLAQEQSGRSGILNVVIDDMRFPHEVAILHGAFGAENVEIWRVENGRHHPYFRMWMCRRPWGRALLAPFGLTVHNSEVWWPVLPADRTILNDSDIPSLFQSLRDNFNQGNFETPGSHRVRVAAG